MLYGPSEYPKFGQCPLKDFRIFPSKIQLARSRAKKCHEGSIFARYRSGSIEPRRRRCDEDGSEEDISVRLS
jgi:hypothetical protein